MPPGFCYLDAGLFDCLYSEGQEIESKLLSVHLWHGKKTSQQDYSFKSLFSADEYLAYLYACVPHVCLVPTDVTKGHQLP